MFRVHFILKMKFSSLFFQGRASHWRPNEGNIRHTYGVPSADDKDAPAHLGTAEGGAEHLRHADYLQRVRYEVETLF